MTERKELFRPEALWHRSKRINSGSLLYQHRLINLVTWSAAALLCALVLLLCMLRYQESVPVRGVLEPKGGTRKVVAPVSAVISEIHVELGQSVSEGQVLATVSTATFDGEGKDAAYIPLQNLRLVRHKLEAERRLLAQRHDQARAQHETTLGNLESAIDLVEHELDIFQQQIALSEQSLAAMNQLLADSGVARINVDERRMAHLELARQHQHARQRQQQLIQSRDQERASLEQGEVDHRIMITRIEGQLADLDGRIEQLRRQDTTAVLAESEGTVVAVTIEVGDAVRKGQPVLYINPEQYELEAVLYVPSRVVGRLYPGQPLMLSYDAFDHLHYGRYRARIAEIGQVGLDPREHLVPVGGINEPVFRVTAHPQQAYVEGPDIYRLQAGFLFSANIIEAEMSLFSFIFKPLLRLREKVS